MKDRLLTWVKKTLGITALEAQVYKTQGALMKLQARLARAENRPLRRDEIERIRKRRRKAAP